MIEDITENSTERNKRAGETALADEIRLINEVNDMMLLNKVMSQLLTEQCYDSKKAYKA